MKRPFIEFEQDQDARPSEPSRRDFLRLMGASLALAGASSCTRAPHGKIIPYASQPPEVTPGVASHYATALAREGYAVGVVVESHEGRPTKIEGNPDHPMSLGGSGIFEQASLLDLYDRDRGISITRRGAISSTHEVIANLAKNKAIRGQGLHFLLEPTSSKLTIDLLTRIRDRLPEAQLHFHAPLSAHNAWRGSTLAFGASLETLLDLEQADVVVAIDSDFLTTGPASLRNARSFAKRRRVESTLDSMSRLYVIEPAPTVTGTSADNRLRVKRSEIPSFLAAIITELTSHLPNSIPADTAKAVAILAKGSDTAKSQASAIARDLLTRRGRSVIVVGEAAPPVAHALAHLANFALGNFGATVAFVPSPIFEAGAPSHSLSVLSDALAANAVDTLVVLGGNPAYATPADLDLANKFGRAKRSLYLGTHENETAAATEFYVPRAHALESWGDARAVDGTSSIIQPLLGAPDACRTLDDVLAYFAGDSRSLDASAHHLTRAYWQRTLAGDFEPFWRETLARGVVANSASSTLQPQVDWRRIAEACASFASEQVATDGFELALREDPRVRDGASTNNPWLLELPDPIHKLTWENAALVSKKTAESHQLSNGDVLTINVGHRSVASPILVVPGVADDTLALSLGYGRHGSEQIADGVGVNGYALQGGDSLWLARGLVITKTAKQQTLALAQNHFSLEGRDEDIFLHKTLSGFRNDPDFARAANAEKKSLYVLPKQGARQWGMVVDLNACTGCSACVVACQAENNIPVVGKAGVAKSREMHWIRIDSYRTEDTDDARSLAQPMLCQHCERAPCEYVCPTNATTHSTDGLNQMVYNRCVGTRFCSNNCPWKVRRFNWFDYQLDPDASPAIAHNPDVTVRGRGVMEKCTYCVQRIREAEITSEVAGRPLRDREFKTACEQACPSEAIVFGDIGDAQTEVSRARKNPRLFAVLNDLGTVPHTRYLAKIDNPNDELP